MFSMLEFILGIFVALILGIVLQFTLLACPDCPEGEETHILFTEWQTGDHVAIPIDDIKQAIVWTIYEDGGRRVHFLIQIGDKYFEVCENAVLMIKQK